MRRGDRKKERRGVWVLTVLNRVAAFALIAFFDGFGKPGCGFFNICGSLGRCFGLGEGLPVLYC